MRAAVYCGTRNVYQDMIPSMKSLLIHSNVDKIYFLIEDDEFPYELPPEVECINVSNQQWFNKNGPNYNNEWSYMILIRAAFTKIFPHLDRILSLDNDVIIRDNISELWEMPLDNYYFAGVKEPKKSTENITYINAGILLFNLKKMREDKKDDEYINNLNNCFRYYPEQECFTALSQGYLLELPGEYNLSKYTSLSSKEKIIHFAARKNWQKLKMVQEYYNLPLSQIKRNQLQEIGLDIIIPTYKKVQNLANTLASITWDNKYPIRVTVIDDASKADYSKLKTQYSQIQWLELENNSGPGAARQYGTEHTSMPYITYLDSGDTFNNDTIDIIFKEIEDNTAGYFYIWHFYDGDTKKQSDISEEKPCGKVYKREFINRYNIHWPSGRASYTCEDYGFVHICRIILSYLQTIDAIERTYTFEESIANLIPDSTSLTHQNNFEFIYNAAVEGLVLNNYEIIKQCKNNNIPPQYIIQELNYMIVKLYWFFLLTINNRPQFSELNWIRIKDFYDTCYSKYELTASKTLAEPYYKYNTHLIMPAMRRWKMPVRININKFLDDLKQYEQLPGRYKF